MAENGEIVSKTPAPKRLPKTDDTPTVVSAPAVEVEDTPEPEPVLRDVDADIEGFMEGELADLDASDHAV
jgi:hypothetical protein